MKLTLLLDMDDTLLANSIDTFVPAYLQLLSRHVGPLAGGNELPKHLLKATQAMLVKRAPGETLESVFDRAFYPPMGTSKAALREPIERFYAEVYPSLRSLTQTRPAAHRLVEDALQAGIDLVVATNPLFPRTAILQRLQWAGFTPEPFRLISSYESFHFAKPNPAYYAEILAQLGWPNQPAAMVGNSLEDDILPACTRSRPLEPWMGCSPG
jgi:FMN phosphatase YigB (HAD superfamily)